MLNIQIKTIPHKKQRYETLGDYYQDESAFKILVSDLNNKDYEFFIALHEFIESYLCERLGIKEELISEFDIKFEDLRLKNPEIIGFQEPGNMVSAPYFEQHQIAQKIERMLVEYLGIDWDVYNSYLDSFTN